MQVIKVEVWEEIPRDYTGIAEFPNGTKQWVLNGKLHREDGPAVEWADGTKCWVLNGKYHREDGPAVESHNGEKQWYLNGKLHRVDGPAREWSDGANEWWLNGERHREDGPACEYINGQKFWYLNNEFLFSLLPESQSFIFLEEFIDEKGNSKIKVLTQQGIEIWPDLSGLKELAENWSKNDKKEN